jgi:hypothetical protein
MIAAPAARRGVRQHIEIALWSLKRIFDPGETLATTPIGLATGIAAKIAAYTYAFLVGGARTWSRVPGVRPDRGRRLSLCPAMVTETKSRSLEEIEADLKKRLAV